MKKNTSIRALLVVASLCAGITTRAASELASTKPDILAAYVKISAALAADNLADAKTAAAALATTAGTAKNQSIADQATAVAKGADLAAVREKYKLLSVSVEPLAAGVKGYTVMHCPMVNADWVQTTGGTMNPFFGKEMLTCGEPKK